MRSKRVMVLLIVVLLTGVLLNVSCSVEISSDTPAPTSPRATAPTAAEVTAEPTVAAISAPVTETEAVSETPESDEAEGEVTVETPNSEPDDAAFNPPPWAALNLTGELVFIAFDSEQRQIIHKLDLVTGELLDLFVAPEGTLLTDVAASPNGEELVFAYAPPVPEGEVQFGFTDLYTMPADGSAAPEPLLERVDSTETFFNLSWPMEDHLYFAHFSPTTGELGETIYKSRVERLRLSTGEIEVLAPEATWPRVSRDGSRLAYVTETNELFLAEADGSNAALFIAGDVYPAMDAPLFSLDNEWLFFSAIEPEESSLSWLDRLFGVRTASAHNVPSDWWRQPTEGGEAERLTNLYEVGMYGDISDDGVHLAFITTSGVQVMNKDGTGVFRLLEIPATGTLNWIWAD